MFGALASLAGVTIASSGSIERGASGHRDGPGGAAAISWSGLILKHFCVPTATKNKDYRLKNTEMKNFLPSCPPPPDTPISLCPDAEPEHARARTRAHTPTMQTLWFLSRVLIASRKRTTDRTKDAHKGSIGGITEDLTRVNRATEGDKLQTLSLRVGNVSKYQSRLLYHPPSCWRRRSS